MTMRTTIPSASRRAFVGLGPAFLQPPSQHRRWSLRRRDWRSFPRLERLCAARALDGLGNRRKCRKGCYRCAVAEQAAAKILLGRESREL